MIEVSEDLSGKDLDKTRRFQQQITNPSKITVYTNQKTAGVHPRTVGVDAQFLNFYEEMYSEKLKIPLNVRTDMWALVYSF